MANLDRHVAAILDAAPHSSLDDEDDLIAQLEDDENDAALDAFREQRIQQLHKELTRAKDQRTDGFGNYEEIKDEKELMDLTTKCRYAIVHFAKDDFARCGVMDRHLRELARKHFDTRFLKINVENALFLVVKLKVQVLPCVLAFVDGATVDRIIGFEGIGYTENTFKTSDLEDRLLASAVIQRAKTTTKFGVKKPAREEYSDDDE
ncbi:unnamed protein product [Discula destructiva]